MKFIHRAGICLMLCGLNNPPGSWMNAILGVVGVFCLIGGNEK
jgi:hypothetical protein